MPLYTPKHFIIFYSWQSDINKNANNHFIKDCIEKAIKELNKQAEITVTLRLDKDTHETTGSPKITDTILKKIDASHLFISDITIINSNWFNKIINRRLTPNPNVLFELGYALYRLTWDRIILLNNDSFSSITDMPFDLQQNRLSRYNFNGKDNKEAARKHLTGLLKKAIKGIIDKYEILLTKEDQRNIYRHDTEVFERLEIIIDDSVFYELLNKIHNYQIVVKEEYQLLDNITTYLQRDGNQFLIPELAIIAKELEDAVCELHSTLTTNLFPKTDRYYDHVEEKEKEETSYHLPENQNYFSTHEEYEAKREERINKICSAVSVVRDSYKKFRRETKNRLFV